MNGERQQKILVHKMESKAESVENLIYVNTFEDSDFRRLVSKLFALRSLLDDRMSLLLSMCFEVVSEIRLRKIT